MNEQLQTKINNINTLQDLYQEREEDLSVIDLYFPSDMDYSLVMASLEKVTAKYGFDMYSLSITKENKNSAVRTDYPGMEKVLINISVIGNRADFKDLITHLESMPVIPNMASLRVDPESDMDTGAEIDAGITIYVYKTI